jgi:hypothetical protein
MLYQSILALGLSYVGNSHKRQNSAIAILWNKCNNRQWARKCEALSYSTNLFVNLKVLSKAKVE